MKPPVHNAKVREVDGYGSGEFGARRKRPDGTIYHHEGVDIVTEPGQTVISPVSGTYEFPYDPYNSDKNKKGRLHAVRIKTDDGYQVNVLYVNPKTAGLAQGQRVVAGQTPIGAAEDITPVYPRNKYGVMTNHVHVEVKKKGRVIDPTPMIRSNRD